MSLTTEICKRIIHHSGIGRNGFGLNSKDLLIPETIDFLNEEESIVKCPVWAGQIFIDDANLRGLASDLSYSTSAGSCKDYIFVWSISDKLSVCTFTPQDSADFGELKLNGRNQTILEQALSLAAFEKLADYGFLWNKCNDDYQDLLAHAKSLL